MCKFSPESLAKLATCHPDLQMIMNEAIKYVDFAIMEGHRDQAAQEAAYLAGNTKLHYPHGKHNAMPSNAVDIAPWPIDFQNAKRFYYLAGLVKGIAVDLREAGKITHDIRWGGQWNGNPDILDEQGLVDLPHIELIT